ncbi:demethylmenaquinone methyltransferase / 2-methoxy-6-polyprenyl-1/4-benzoquinol methylase [Synechococcus sp. BIOS-U3-1]|mgnify:FL=1|uniref:class I SAM-dependent methyltransferase n=1 Tax=Synechococcus sp. BIOS-U3-1 TaxID=1400865 RepID=UPI001649029C|nr:methyltransferase domain-containing protein [Synechococcus sp. BIOS-U3-1]QNI59304.1 demethylmenaquinone methyltransferase / 2-methoxy-6-polyprenyl-1/4-benzoquinol methylase [Synechococcus sp. BIOS-U3-1]|tara:strand:+ start:1381 stop:2031 length:651 start_codon:yes stop_codon:yes gene_type:complete
MTSFLRPLAYRYRWIYDTVTAISSLSVGGVEQLRRLGLEALQSMLEPGAPVLDLCCGSGEAAAPWLAAGFDVTGLDLSPLALALAARRHPSLKRVEGLAEEPPLQDGSFCAIQLSVALHEFPRRERELVLRQSLRLLKPGGWLVIVDLHPAGPWLRLPQQLFCALFETDTATSMLEDDLPSQLQQLGFTAVKQELLAGQALQRITAARPRIDAPSS